MFDNRCFIPMNGGGTCLCLFWPLMVGVIKESEHIIYIYIYVYMCVCVHKLNKLANDLLNRVTLIKFKSISSSLFYSFVIGFLL